MLPSSHLSPMNLLTTREIEPTLADAFSTFAAAAGQLEFSYRELQKESMRMRRELEMRNAAIAETLTENQSMRMALRCILDTLPCGVAVLGASGEIVFLNVEAQSHLQAHRTKEVEKNLSPELLSTHDLLAQITARVSPDSEETEILIPGTAQPFWLAVRARTMHSPYPVSGSGRGPSTHGRLVLITRDITAQKRAQQDQEETARLIALARMSAVLAHEIRNPLASMELLIGLLYGCDELKSDQRSWIDGLRAGIRSLSATVNNVLRYHSLGTSALKPVRLSQVLRESVQFVQPLAKQADITLIFEDELGEQTIAGNPGELQQVLFNLTLNAFRHTSAGGTVKVKAAKAAQGASRRAAVEVSDTGEGIRAEYLPQLFEAGFSATGQTPGLGLAVCKKIVELHRGTLSVSSQVGAGSSFRLEFPFYD
jgi:two-component system sensor histidine kinase FlrB